LQTVRLDVIPVHWMLTMWSPVHRLDARLGGSTQLMDSALVSRIP